MRNFKILCNAIINFIQHELKFDIPYIMTQQSNNPFNGMARTLQLLDSCMWALHMFTHTDMVISNLMQFV